MQASIDAGSRGAVAMKRTPRGSAELRARGGHGGQPCRCGRGEGGGAPDQHGLRERAAVAGGDAPARADQHLLHEVLAERRVLRAGGLGAARDRAPSLGQGGDLLRRGAPHAAAKRFEVALELLVARERSQALQVELHVVEAQVVALVQLDLARRVALGALGARRGREPPRRRAHRRPPRRAPRAS